MDRELIVDFTKMHGSGNDFVIIDNRFFRFSDAELDSLAKRTCPRRTGIGADGLLALNDPSEPDHHFRMRYFNPDGSSGMMCGNGARCLSRFAFEAGIRHHLLVFESDAGIYESEVLPDGNVRLFVPPPQDFREVTGLTAKGTDISDSYYIWTGTDHLVCFVNDVDIFPVGELGPFLRRDPQFDPRGVNANFVEVLNHAGAVVKVRTYEKGVEGETMACGTGAIAAAVVSRLVLRLPSDRIEVRMRGGVLYVGFDGAAEREVRDAYLEGTVETTFRGTFAM